MVGETKLSNGSRLTTADWRANRLCDALAKREAARRELLAAIRKLLDSAGIAVKFSAKLLGRVTHAANNYKVADMDGDGNVFYRTLRDATPAPKGHKRKANAQPPKPAPPKKPVKELTVKPWCEPVVKAGKASAAHLHRTRENAFQNECTKRRISEIGASLEASSSRVCAATRLDELARRVRQRAGTDEPQAGGML